MTGFSIRKDKWLTFLVIGMVMLLILPILAGAQTGVEGTSPATDEATEGISTGDAEEAAAEPEAPEQPEPQEVTKYHYFVLHSTKPDAPIEDWDIVASFPADTRFTYQQPGYFGFASFFADDPNPEEPMELVEPTEPEEPNEGDYADDPRLYKELVEKYQTDYAEYQKNLKGYSYYKGKYPDLLKKYNAEVELFNKDKYPVLKHYYFFTRNIPNSKPKKSIYRLSVKQFEKPEPPEEPEQPVTEVGPGDEIPAVDDTTTAVPSDEVGEPGEGIESEETSAGVIPVDEPSMSDELITTSLEEMEESREAANPYEPPPGDLVLPKDFWIADRPSDQGGTISLHWETTESDQIKVEHIPEAKDVEAAEEEEEEKAKPEYDLGKFIVEAWVYDPDIDLTSESEIEAINVVVDVSRLGGDKELKLDFIEVVEDPEKFDHGLGLHFKGTFTNQLTEVDILGKHTIRAKATAQDMPTRRGKVKINKIAGEPVDATNEESAVPDNRYMHYFKLGVDLWDHDGPPRWIVPQDPPKGLVAKANILNMRRWNILVFAILYTISILGFIAVARRGKKLFVRRIAGLDHVEEAIGRATEMGKPILFIPGIGSMADVATIAAINILGQVTRKVAEYDSRIIVPNKDPIVMTVAQEVTQEAYIDAGHPDRYRREDVFFVTDDQFAFTAAVDGIMVREKPATIFLMGMFYAESLILAETGASTGAIQIAGTDATHQLPFFITACDYTLIGEELYAASAYLAREPLLLGSLKGQDLAKAFLWVCIIVGVILSSIGIEFLTKLFISLQ